MAENKKSFIAYVDWKETFDALPNEKAGQLVKHLFAYVNDENPVSDDVLINAVFANIKQTLKRDLDKYELIIQRNRENGSKGGRPRSKNVKPRKPSGIFRNPDKPNETQTNPEKHDSDNDSDNDSKELNQPKKVDLITQIVNCFVEEHGSYEIMNWGIEKKMAGKILKKYKDKFPTAKTDDTLKALRMYFKACVNINDPWLKDNMSLSIIVSKFNVINKILNDGKSKNSGITNIQLANLVASKIGIDAYK